MSKSLETLEPRRLMHAELSASFHFQPADAAGVRGYVSDTGTVYGRHKNGLAYGWNADATAGAVDRNASRNQKNDTFIAMQQGGNKTWSLAVEDGLYRVYVFAGDPAGARDRMGITVEDQVAVSGVTSRRSPFLDGSVIVNVTDGRLTVGNSGRAVNNKIGYVQVQSVEASDLSTLAVTASRSLAREAGSVFGQFTVTRTGSTRRALTVPIRVGGTATSGSDYAALGASVRFAAGQDTALVRVRPVDDRAKEGDETVTVRLGTPSGYFVLGPSATVTVRDDDSGGPTPSPSPSPTPTKLTWSTKAGRPLAASEIFGAAVGGKVYTFGGFINSSYRPTKASYAYDVAGNTWSQLADLPVGLTHPGVADDGNRYIYIAAGYPGNGSGGSQTFSSTDVYRYDTVANTYSTLPDLPAARGAGALGLLGHTLYFAGGDDSNRHDVTSVYALDLSDADAGWKTRASLPAPRNHAALLAVDDELFFVAGQTNQDQNLTTQSTLYRYDPDTDRWTTRASLPGGRSHITDATFVYDGKIVVVAGQSAFEAPLSSVLEYDPDADKWVSLAGLPAARFSGVGDLVGNKVVYTAGYNGGFKSDTYVATIG